ncbi:MAG TPA: YajD family HNH nuclease [Syntrophales bacterium]|nr:YajD family HNH nuclease [Syntrophales bacterium]HOM07696.1 YajD family HNH nuclease [Syntrophales bacterium]HOO00264.1 YajD family HNH nuclease [Syntrophales bacterium]HPC01763.1 YajD family HNH nuclease [Syntrophales bacterium]HPQ07220.1 YajD family HNH nuclease [Syntrophales bacterium]
MTFTKQGRRVRAQVRRDRPRETRPVEEVVRALKTEEKGGREDYRERSLAIHGLVCARCGRSFDEGNRHLLTVHHKDGNHHNNPPDGSNWENLCVYCHEDVHSRGLLADYLAGGAAREEVLVHAGEAGGGGATGLSSLGEKLKKAFEKK